MLAMNKTASHEEVLEILSEQARHGSVRAAAALEWALRHRDDNQVDEVGEAIDRILAKNR